MKNYQLLLLSLTLLAACQTQQSAEQPQHTHPVWSGDGTKIAFIDNSEGIKNGQAIDFEVFTVDADGSNLQQHTFNEAFEADIAWSEDGTMLAFKSYRDENDEVYLLDLGTGVQTNISNHPKRDGSPQFVGDQLIFYSERDQDSGELYAYSLVDRRINRLTFNEFSESGAVWSADGSMIVFTSNMDGDDDLYLMKSSGDSLVQLTNNPLNDWYPQWYPDGQSIVYTYGDWETDQWELRQLNLSDLSERIILDTNDSGNASVSPDGSMIAYGSSRLGSSHVFIRNMSDGDEKQLTE